MPEDRNEERRAQQRSAVAATVRALIEGVRQGEPLHTDRFELIPLAPAPGRTPRRSGYLPLEEALRLQLVAITEQAQAQVPELQAVSQADAPVVMIGGEQVIGGLQNRVLNTTILLAPHAVLKIPVTCVEAGRWNEGYAEPVETPQDIGDPWATEASAQTVSRARPGRSARRAFTSDEAAYARLRKLHAESVTASLATDGEYRSDQGAVWDEVAERMRTTGSHSRSGAMYALYASPERARKLKETVEALPWPDGAVGFIAALGGVTLGIELFSDATLARAYWNKLARSYALEALDEVAQSDEPPHVGDGSRLLADALAADIQVHASPGLGLDARLVSASVSGAGLVHDDSVVHLSLFPGDGTAVSDHAPSHRPRSAPTGWA